MTVYEFAYITTSEEKDLLKGVEDVISQFGGKVTQKDEWGEKPFAYRIGKLSRGFYHIWNFTIESDQLNELKKRLNIDERVVRYLILKVD